MPTPEADTNAGSAARRRAAGDQLAVWCLIVVGLWVMTAVAWWSAASPQVPTPIPASPDLRIDLNTAESMRLELLPGIGPALAGRIIADRTARGPFRSLGDLQRVRGIGAITAARLQRYVTVAFASPPGLAGALSVED